MTKQLEYKGYLGSVEVDVPGNCIFGRILLISDIITYSADTIAGIQAAFEEAVDDYVGDETVAEDGCRNTLGDCTNGGISATHDS